MRTVVSELPKNDDPASGFLRQLAHGQLFDTDKDTLYTGWADTPAEAEEKSRAFTLMMKDVFPKRLNSDKSKLRVKDTSLKDVRVVFDETALPVKCYNDDHMYLLTHDFYILAKLTRSAHNRNRDGPLVFGYLRYAWWYYKKGILPILKTTQWQGVQRDLETLLDPYSVEREDFMLHQTHGLMTTTVRQWTWWDSSIRSLHEANASDINTRNLSSPVMDRTTYEHGLQLSQAMQKIVSAVMATPLARVSPGERKLESVVATKLRELEQVGADLCLKYPPHC